MEELTNRFIACYEYLKGESFFKNDTEFAQKLDVSRSMVTEILKGRSNPGAKALQNIVITFQIDATWLLTGFGKMIKEAVNEQIPHTANGILNEPQPVYGQIPQGVQVKKGKEIVSPTVSPTTQLGVKTVYLTPQIVTVDNAGNDNIVYVPMRAAAGYLNGYADRTYIESLPAFSLPGLNNSTYRAFEVAGDSMSPTLENKEMVIGQWVEKLDYIREDRVYILVTKNDGIIVKRLLNRIEKYGYIVAKSDAVNDRNLYPNIEVHPNDILEIWYAVWHGGFNFKTPGDLWKRQNNLEADLSDVLRRLKQAGL